MQIDFKGTIYPCLSAALAGRDLVQGASRMTFKAAFDSAAVSLEDIVAVYSDTAALGAITVTDGDSVTVRKDFSIPVELTLKDGTITLTVAERTAAEKEQAELKKLMQKLLEKG